MNHQSPNTNLGEYIRLMNSNFDNFNIVGFDNCNYVTESSIISFMEDNNLDDRNGLLETIAKYNNINEITLLDESIIDEDLIFVRDILMICESLNPLEVAKVAKGRTLLRSGVDQIISLIKNEEYDESANLDKYIEQCDDMLKKIFDEKKKIREGSNDDRLKFSAMFAFNIAKNLFMIFVLPVILKKKVFTKVKWPEAIKKLFMKKEKVKTAADMAKAIKIKNDAKAALTGVNIVTSSIPSDIAGLYLSFKDYDKLLTDYEFKIKDLKTNFKRQKAYIAKKKEMNVGMVKFKEDCTSIEATEVHYQTPKELQIQDHTPEIFHDTTPVEVPTDKPANPEVAPPVVKPSIEQPPHPVEEPHSMAPAFSTEFSPLDAIYQAKCDPHNVPIARYGDKYYIDYRDLQCYMDSCGEPKYENALDTIIKSHEGSGLCEENIRVIMGKQDASNLDEETRLKMESSTIRFEVY